MAIAGSWPSSRRKAGKSACASSAGCAGRRGCGYRRRAADSPAADSRPAHPPRLRRRTTFGPGISWPTRLCAAVRCACGPYSMSIRGSANIEPGSPWQNGFVELFHSRFRDESLNREQLWTLSEARVVIETFRVRYNQKRPRGKVGYQTPASFAAKISIPGSGQARRAGPSLRQRWTISVRRINLAHSPDRTKGCLENPYPVRTVFGSSRILGRPPRGSGRAGRGLAGEAWACETESGDSRKKPRRSPPSRHSRPSL